MSGIGERLKKARKHAKMTQAQLAKAINTSQGAISDLENGRNSTSTYIIQMSSAMGVNAEWLATGKGEMIVSDDENISNIIKNTSSPIVIDSENDYRVQIPFYDITFCCGDGNGVEVNFVEQKKTLGFEESFFEKRNLKPSNCKMFTAVGDSMQYYICDGDAVMIDITDIEPLENEVYAVYFEGERMIRRFEKRQGGVICLVADNPKYKEKIVSDWAAVGFKIIGRVVYRSG